MRISSVMLSALLAIMLAASPATHAAPQGKQVDRILIEKGKRLMTLYAAGKPLHTYRIALGGNPKGHKQQEGDMRTPEGNYRIDARNAQSSFHRSLRISYPNAADRRSARRRGVSPGGAIMIHGTPGSIQTLRSTGIYSDWTAGCVAVSNREIEEIFALVKNGTPVTILP